MAITYNQKNRIFTLNTNHSTYQMKVDKFGILLHLYYGAKISGDADYLLTCYDRGFSGSLYDMGDTRVYSMDVQPQEYPVFGVGDYRNSALVIQNADGSECCDLRYVTHEIKKGKYSLSGLPAVYAKEEESETLKIVLEDSISRVQVQLLFGVLENEDIITRSARILNLGTDTITVEKAASACLDYISGDYDLITFYGRHAMERNFQRAEILHGSMVIGSRRGTSSHQYNPAVIVADKSTTEDFGNCYGMLFVYSGSFMCETEKDQFGQTRVLMGLQSDLFHYPLSENEVLTVPETILSFSDRGLGELSRQYHRCIRDHICRGGYAHKLRPVLINSWETAYFDFNGDTICRLAEDAAELGIDMVVMDDGWFGKRDDDNSGLGDWKVNEQKLGCTLGELIQRVNKYGIKFGIWIEPEMVSEDSDLYRKHPDWTIQIPGRKPIRGRNQLVLDFSRQEVRNAVFESICSILNQGNIEYIKWDMNRSLADIYSIEYAQGRVTYEYMLGVYDFLEKLTQRYPNILIEGCSGGGGRFDAGMLYYTPQIWCSDNTDAIDRLKIQYGTSFGYPVNTMGAHVSACPNHQNGRITPLSTRGVVAMAGTFGYELDISKMTEEEKGIVKEQIETFKSYADLIAQGEYYRLSNATEENVFYVAWEFVKEDKTEALLSYVQIHPQTNLLYVRIRWKGLDPRKNYKVEKEVYSGEVLMNIGYLLPVLQGDYRSFQIHIQEQA